MQSFLSELSNIKEANSIESLHFKERLRSLAEFHQRELSRSREYEQAFLENSRNFQLVESSNDELDIKLKAQSQASETLKAQLNLLTQNLETIHRFLKAKEKSRESMIKDISSYQELIEMVSNSNRFLEENLRMSLQPLDLSKIGIVTAKNKAKVDKKSGFIDFLQRKKDLEAKKYKLKVELSEASFKRKQEMLRFSSKIRNLRASSEAFRSSMIAENDRRIQAFKADLRERQAEIQKNRISTAISQIDETTSIDHQIFNLKKGIVKTDLRLKYLGSSKFPAAQLKAAIEGIQTKITGQQEKELELSSILGERQSMICSELSRLISELKASTLVASKACKDIESSHLTRIRDLNSLKFELCLIRRQAPCQTSNPSILIKTFMNLAPSFQIDEVPVQSSQMIKMHTLCEIESEEGKLENKLESPLAKKPKKLKNTDFSPELKISSLEHYQLKSKLNSIKEDHMLFSSFIDFRLNPMRSPLKKIEPLGSNNPKPSTSKFETPNPTGSSSHTLEEDSNGQQKRSLNAISSPQEKGNNLENEEIERVLREEEVLSWGGRQGVLMMVVFWVISQMFSIANNAKRRLFC